MFETTQGTSGELPDSIRGKQERRQLVERVLASESFRKSPKLSAFLHFICEQEETGNARIIHEQMIGVKVFERRPGYSVGDDSIVRSQARLLRQRLDDYFAKDGRRESLIIVVPKGSYVPAFQPRGEAPAGAPAEAPARAEASQAPAGYTAVPQAGMGKARRLWWVGLGVVVLLLGIFQAVRLRFAHNDGGGQRLSLTSVFWGSIFEPGGQTVIVPSDSSLVVMEQLLGGPVQVQAYSTKQYLKNGGSVSPGLWDFVAESQYTNVADLNFVAHIVLLPEAAKSRPVISYARDLSLKELKDGNAVLIGGSMANPWVELFAPSVHFDVGFDWASHHGFVNNRAAKSQEKGRYVEIDSGKEGEYEAFGVIAYVPSLGTHGHSLLVEGTSKGGTEAAAEFLSSDAFRQFLQQAAKGGATIPDFELLLSTRSLRGASHDSTVVCWHELKQN